MTKQIFRVRNWGEYNKALVNRGSITLWFPENFEKNWCYRSPVKLRGGQKKYSDMAITLCLIFRGKYGLTLRETQGFVQSIFDMKQMDLNCPDYTSICRRAQEIDIEIPRSVVHGSIDVVFDSTGFKIYGEGEWKVRQHGYSKRRTWVKLHIGVNPKDHTIVAEEVTSNSVTDDKVFSRLLEQIPHTINSTPLDGAYDKKGCYIAAHNKGAIPIVPPRKDAVISNDPDLVERNFAITYIKKHGGGEEGRKMWKIASGYHKRSIAETAMFRLKQLFSDRLKSRKFLNQTAELKVRIAILNKMTLHGMPDSYCVANN
jgi:hypothetical protein